MFRYSQDYSGNQDYSIERKPYSPQLSIKSSISVRRLSCALGIPMTKVLELIINKLPLIFSTLDICSKCHDNSECENCVFNNQVTATKTETITEKTANAA